MNNMQKAFKTKSKLRGMADGGSMRPTPEMLGDGMAARAGVLLRDRTSAIDSQLDGMSSTSRPAAPQPAAAPATTAPSQGKGKSALRSFFGLADGGVAAGVSNVGALAQPRKELTDGGRVEGPGGPTEDRVGPVALSAEEYVLPADTVKVVGRENLDRLRLATHDFVEPKNKPQVPGMRQMADGGALGDVGPARRTALRGALGAAGRLAAGPVPILAGAAYAAATDPAGTAQAGNNMLRGVAPQVNVRFPGGEQAPYTPPASWNAPTPPAAVQSRVDALQGIAGRADARAPALAAAAERGAPMAAAAGGPAAAQAPTQSSGSGSVDDAMRRLRLGGAPGGGFTPSGYADVSRRDNPMAGQPGQSAREYVGMGAPSNAGGQSQEDPVMSELRSALRGAAGNNRGVSTPSSNANAINERFDSMLRRGSGSNFRHGADWSTRHALTVARAREAALGDDARNAVTARGQDLQAGTADANRQAQLQAQVLQSLTGLAGQRAQGMSSLRNAQTQAMGAAETRDDARANRGAKSLVDYATRQFGEDSPERLEFENSFRATNPDFMTMPEGDRESLLAQFKETWDAQAPVRERAAALGRPAPVGEVQIGEATPVTAGDWWNDRATLGDWWESFRVLGENAPTARNIPTGDGASNFVVSEEDLVTRPDGSKRQDVMSRLRRGGVQ